MYNEKKSEEIENTVGRRRKKSRRKGRRRN
jgi:hypothetical protein